LVFLKESFVRNEFFRGACGANGDLFYDSWFNGNANFDYGGDVGHVSIFKTDSVVELVYMLQRNKILGFNCAHRGLGRRMKGLL
jgi:hypothetical protein